MDSETETDYTDVTLSPAKDLDQPRSTIPKPLFSKNGFHSLPHSSSMKSRLSNSWEANNLMEEMRNITKGNQAHKNLEHFVFR